MTLLLSPASDTGGQRHGDGYHGAGQGDRKGLAELGPGTGCHPNSPNLAVLLRARSPPFYFRVLFKSPLSGPRP